MNRRYVVAALALALFSPVGAEMEFGDVDKNQDGFISAEEATLIPELEENMANFDLDEDGQLSEDEYTDYMDAAEAADKGG